MPAGVAGVIGTALASAGVGATTAGIIGTVVTDAAIGASIGAGGSAILGGDPLKGALFGGITGGALGFGGPLSSGLGLEAGGFGAGVLDVGLGAVAGVGGAAATGMPLGKGALFGGAAGGLNALLSGPATGATSPNGAAPAGGGPASGGPAAASAISQGGIPDLTATGATTLGSPAAGGAISVSDLGAPGAGASAAAGAPLESITISGSAPGAAAPLGGGAAAAGGIGATGTKGIGSGAIQVSDLSPGPDGSAGGGLSTPLGGTSLGQVAPAGGATTSLGKFVEHPSVGAAGSVIGANPSTAAAVLGLGYQALTQPKLPSESGLTSKLLSTADEIGAQGAQLRDYINTGNLPPGAAAAIHSATESAKASVRSQYASMGLSGSTAETTALSQIDQQAAGEVFNIANSLLQTGIKESGLSEEIYKALLSNTTEHDKELSGAISNFAASIAGGGNRPGVNINLGGAGA